ncbi:hypothetical protein HPULCUR_005179 [Helicostylum pulchrum]|uniref:Uncharacterized protein n=1 Tax=Helicostylum pulchrum TaxID=562976 RepID=A0ABP9Y0F0_9FUNG
MFLAEPIPLLMGVAPNDNAMEKRQVEQPTSVVHVTITASGTVVYTHTATSYSFIPSYSTITTAPTATSTHNGTHPGTSDSNPSSSSSPNLGAIIGGAIGGVAFIALIGITNYLFVVVI